MPDEQMVQFAAQVFSLDFDELALQAPEEEKARRNSYFQADQERIKRIQERDQRLDALLK